MTKKRTQFFTPRTAGFIQQLTDEYINRMNQEVLYYKVNGKMTDTGDLYSKHYNESSNKVFDEPILIQCNAFIHDKNTENFRDTGYELRTQLDVFFHIYDLEELNVYPSMGDIISFQGLFFEIYDMNDATLLHGDPEYKYGFTVNCLDIRVNDYEDHLETDIQYKRRINRYQ